MKSRAVENIEEHWAWPPPAPSARLTEWLERIQDGWRPNSRIRYMGYYEASEFYGVYIWEYFHAIRPALEDAE